MAKSIVIAERDNIAAVFEDSKVTEFFVHKGDILLGDVYMSKVENILPSIEAAFVNVGSDKMGFLHAADVIGKGGLQDKLSPKQRLMVQVVKEPTGHKGPRVTTSISLPGRFLVLMPQETGVSVSKKISTPKERARLKSIVNLLKPVGLGIIIRTEAEGQSEAEIQEDLEILLEKWNTIVTQAELVTAPNLLYRDQDLLYRVIREACDEDVKEIVVDTAFALHRTQQLIQNWNLNKDIELTVYKGTEPLLVASGVKKEIQAALQTKVNMPSGGYLFIQTTEALTVIDVNSGKFISSATQDETILKTNQEAVHEIARQLKLRNIGGMIIIDFIDMLSRTDKIAILEELELAIESDKSKPQVGQLSDLGLVEMTRHRQGQSLAEVFSKKCPTCGGTGYVVEEMNFSSAVAEGEYRSKTAKLKLPMNNYGNKHKVPYPDKSNNKVFNHQNPNTPNGQQNKKNDYDRKSHQKTAVIEVKPEDGDQIKQTPQIQQPSNNQNTQRPQRDNRKKRFNNNSKKEVLEIVDELLEHKSPAEELKVDEQQIIQTVTPVDAKTVEVEQIKQEPVPEEKAQEPKAVMVPEESKPGPDAEETVAADAPADSEPAKKVTGKGKPRRATRTRRKSSEKTEKTEKVETVENAEKAEQNAVKDSEE